MTERRHTVLEGNRIRRITNPDNGQVDAAILGNAPTVSTNSSTEPARPSSTSRP